MTGPMGRVPPVVQLMGLPTVAPMGLRIGWSIRHVIGDPMGHPMWSLSDDTPYYKTGTWYNPWDDP